MNVQQTALLAWLNMMKVEHLEEHIIVAHSKLELATTIVELPVAVATSL
jgi:hypothetical protein